MLKFPIYLHPVDAIDAVVNMRSIKIQFYRVKITESTFNLSVVRGMPRVFIIPSVLLYTYIYIQCTVFVIKYTINLMIL